MADVEALLGALSLEEKAALTAGGDLFATAGVERLGIPPVGVTDGPNGARGSDLPGVGGTRSTCIPCGSAIGATWDPALAEELGGVVGREARDRACFGLLAPTVNLHRHPLAGRNFECYSEDPLLSGRLAAGYVRGAQASGVFATVKHFVGNEAEFERSSIDSVVDERSLRELYLLPFELAVKEGGALGIMTSYNRLNGSWVTEQRALLTDLLRGEWGFDGLVMTDWFAVASTEVSAGAGLDLEMPVPGRALGANLVEAVKDGRVDEADVDRAVRAYLGTLDRVGALDSPEPPPVQPQPQSSEDVALLRRAAADATVLLANDGVLPLEPGAVATVAVLGPRAAEPCIMGGGSAQVTPHRLISPLEALVDALGSTEVVHRRGAEVSLNPTVLGGAVLRAPEGFELERFDTPDLSGEVVERDRLDELKMIRFGIGDHGLPDRWSARVSGTVVPEEGGTFELGLAQAGRARVLLDGEVVLDGVADPPPPGGTEVFGMVSKDLVAEVELREGEPVEVVVEYANVDAAAAFRVGFRTPDAQRLVDEAVAAAQEADVAVVFVGTSGDWETEGRDRESFALPGGQDELVRAVVAANPRTVVVVNAAAPVGLPWADDVAALLQCWFGGQELGPALADVLTGAVEPGGRLATSLPVRLEHSPSHGNFPGENGQLRYGEGLFMGYRGFEHRAIEPRFCFGHGLGYTTFELGEPTLSATTFEPGGSLTVSVPVTNTGSRAGSEVVQLYVAPEAPRLVRPPKELKAFAKVRLEPGESRTVELVLDDRSFAYWDPGQPDWDEVSTRPGAAPMMGGPAAERREPGWQVDPGRYELLVGRSSRDVAHRIAVTVA